MMMTLRCTQKLIQRLPLPSPQKQLLRRPPTTHSDGDIHTDATVAGTALGDWFATIIITRPAHLVLCMSEKSRLGVLVPAREPKHLVPRFVHALEAMLREMGANPAAIAHELQQMQEITISDTRGVSTARSMLSSMTEYTRHIKGEIDWLGWRADEAGLLALSLHQCDIPCGPMGMDSPFEVTLRLLYEETGHSPPCNSSPGLQDRPRVPMQQYRQRQPW
jgi:hypothetical protein